MASENRRFTDRAHHVFAIAEEEARGFGHKRMGTEHLLLGIIHEGQATPEGFGKGIAASMLESQGLRLGAVQDQVLQAMGVDTSDGTSSET